MLCIWTDLVIGSDLVYNDAGVRMLPRVLAALAGGRTRILYAHTLYRFEQMDLDFFEELKAIGLCCRTLWPPCSDRPESPEPMTELFPEQYVAIFELSLADVSAHGEVDGATGCEGQT